MILFKRSYIKKMRTKNINPYRTTCQFVDERIEFLKTTREGEAPYGLVLFKGYVDKEGFYVGLIMMYHATGELRAIGHYDETNRLAFDRRIGHWKFFYQEGTLYTEEIYIK